MSRIVSSRRGRGVSLNREVCSREITRPMHVLAVLKTEGYPAMVLSAERTSRARTMLPRNLDYGADPRWGAGGNVKTCDMVPRMGDCGLLEQSLESLDLAEQPISLDRLYRTRR
jgi:hypothetical protein